MGVDTECSDERPRGAGSRGYQQPQKPLAACCCLEGEALLDVAAWLGVLQTAEVLDQQLQKPARRLEGLADLLEDLQGPADIDILSPYS